MTEQLPSPLVAPDCDCTDLDGFMLNTERLMASELIALSNHEVVAAALFLWCRAWKQMPAASLPDDDRVNAAFAKLPIARFRKMKDEILRGFVKCSDGRLYHRVLAAEATRAFGRKAQFRRKREVDAERLRRWRETHDETRFETDDVTHVETQDETRSVRTGTGTGTGTKKERKKDAVNGEIEAPAPPAQVLSPQERLWRDGPNAIGALAQQPAAKFRSVIGSWLKANPAERVLEAIAKAQAEKAVDPVPFIAACLNPKRKGPSDGVIPLDF